MVFLHNDFYTASGSVKLYHSWTDKVTKFDTSSFYNWEQDNLPLYDLDERTYYLWEQLGHPTSSLPGVVLVVSGGGDPSEYEYNRNNFETLSAAVEALPQVLNYPVIIEVCNKGDLGELNLKNIKCGPTGSLEIVNKVFAKAEPDFNTIPLHTGTVYGGDPYNLIGSISGAASSLTYSVSFTARKHFLDSKSEFLNKNIFDTTSLASIDGELNGFVTVIAEDLNTRATYFTKSTSIGTNANVLNLVPFEKTSEAINDHLINTYDISAYDKETGSLFVTGLTTEDSTLNRMLGLFYGNNCSKVVVTNCDGPIYIRNIFVDGDGYNSRNKNGFEITNSRDVYLENCVSVKNTNAGFNILNSKVVVTRGIGAYRNYNYINDDRLVDASSDSNLYRDVRDFAAGLIATNSDIQFSSTANFERSVFEQDPVFSAVSAIASLQYGLNYPINFSRNANGIVLINSNLHGGIAGASSTSLVCELNNLCGFRVLNSTITWDGRLKARQNTVGLLSENSNLVLDKYTISENTRVGMLLNKSNLLYNKNLIKPSSTEKQFNFNFNGQHLRLNGSNYSYVKSQSIPTKYDRHSFLNCNEKSIHLDNTSKLSLVHAYVRSRQDIVGAAIRFGDPVCIENNSTAVFKGSKDCATTIFGRIADQRYACGVYVNKNSSVEFQGPTAIAQYGIDGLVENNSVINFNPHKDETSGELQIKEFNLSDSGNHTMVELHSTRACLVANKNSIINMEDLGDYSVCWERSEAGTIALASGLDYDTSIINEYVSGGFIQFYPNPMDDAGAASLQSTANQLFSVSTVGSLPAYYYMFNRGRPFNEFSSITHGGVCVRALADSIVNIKNVNFPAGFWNPSGVFFDSSTDPENGGFCSWLFIWNIADTSKLFASYCSVSSLFPASVGYHGPLGVWLSSLQSNATLSGTIVSAVSPTNYDPYLGTCSLLDFAGSGPSTINFFTSSFANQGPFRLFFSTDPAVNTLGLVSAGYYSSLGGNYFNYGWIPQAFSQGYYPPGYLSAVSSTSLLHKSLIRFTGTPRVYSTSGIFRPTDGYVAYNTGSTDIPIAPNYAGIMQAGLSPRVFLDESAASIFANAKHCAAGKSGAPKVVSIYYPHLEVYGDSNYDNKSVGFGITTLNSFDLSRDN